MKSVKRERAINDLQRNESRVSKQRAARCTTEGHRCIATAGMLSVAGVESQDFLHKEHRKQQAASGHKLANL